MKQNQRITKVIPFAVILLAFLLMPILGLNSRSWINLFITIVINIVVACSLRVITLSGNISFAHGAFMGVGAYTAGMLGVYLNWPIWLTIPLGAVLATVTGIITGWPFARLKTIYFCMGTMFMGQAIVLLISSWDLAGGAMALRGIPSLSSALGGLADALGGEVKSYQLVFYLILIVALICLLIMYRFVRQERHPAHFEPGRPERGCGRLHRCQSHVLPPACYGRGVLLRRTDGRIPGPLPNYIVL